MHGTIFVLFKRFVTVHYDFATWHRFLEQAGLSEDPFVMKAVYPDEDIVQLVGIAAQQAGTTVPQMLERFGEFLVPDLLFIYRTYLRPEWRTMEMIENVELSMHEPIRREAPGIHPPVLHCERIAPHILRVQYVSPRRMGGLALGIIRGLARHFGEEKELNITATSSENGERVEVLVEQLTPDRRRPTA